MSVVTALSECGQCSYATSPAFLYACDHCRNQCVFLSLRCLALGKPPVRAFPMVLKLSYFDARWPLPPGAGGVYGPISCFQDLFRLSRVLIVP
jgi:hypothetical protein